MFLDTNDHFQCVPGRLCRNPKSQHPSQPADGQRSLGALRPALQTKAGLWW